MRSVLIANRGEIAVRIARAVARRGLRSVVVHPADDASSLHVRLAERSVPLPGRGAAAYLDQEAIIAAAGQAGCDAIHPGYGFLSENAEFARLCAAAGLTFIGPSPEVLDLFGNKARARALAQDVGVAAQIAIAQGCSLVDLGLREPPAVRGFAIQARINLEAIGADGTVAPQTGTIVDLHGPSGPGIRFDHYAYAGYSTSLSYDSLVGKVIAHDADFPHATALLAQALREIRIDGVGTNLPFLRAIVADRTFRSGHLDTGFIGEHLQSLLAGSVEDVRLAIGNGGPAAGGVVEKAAGDQPGEPVSAPMHGVVVGIAVAPGSRVRAEDTLIVLEAMKMEHVVRARRAGRVLSVAVAEGQSVVERQLLLRLDVNEDADDDAASPPSSIVQDEGWQPEVDEIGRRKAAARAHGGADKVARQKAQGKLTARERIEALLDGGSFREIGALTAFSRYDADGALVASTPANFVAGTGTIAGRTVMVGGDDFTIRAGSGDAARHEKQIFAERYAREMRMPVVRLLDGASGGGSVTIAQEAGYQYLPVNPGWDAVVDLLSLTPVVAAALGPTVGLGAARLAMSHLSIMVEGIGQVFTAGPPIVAAATGEHMDKEALGGTAVHGNSGVVDRVVGSEEEAFTTVRSFLSYLPASVFELPPVDATADPADRREDDLLRAIPRNPRAAYRLAPILDAIFDAGRSSPMPAMVTARSRALRGWTAIPSA